MPITLSRRNLLKAFGSAAAIASMPIAFPTAANASAAEAVKLALGGDFLTAASLAKQSGDPAAVKTVELLFLRDHPSDAGYARIMAFLDASPGWPLRDTLQRRAEQALYETREAAAIVLSHFSKREPVSVHGRLVLARAQLAVGDKSSAQNLLGQAWSDANLPYDLEASVVAEFKPLLTTELHKDRLWQLIFAQQGGTAQRHAKAYLPSEYHDTARVAYGLINYEAGAPRKYAELPETLRSQMAMLYVLARFHRKQANYAAMRSIMQQLPHEAAKLGNAAAWAEERRVLVRRSVGPFQSANYNTSYLIAKNHALTTGDLAMDNEFLAGWVALRFLSQTNTALPHFQKLKQLAACGTDHARADYWLGRTQLKLGNKAVAHSHFAAAAKHATVYYGQLAREEIGRGTMPEEIAPGAPSEAARNRIESDELVRALRLVAQAGNKALLNIFYLPLIQRFEEVDQLNTVASLVSQTGGTAAALRFSKAASQRGKDLDAWSYPIYGLPQWTQIGKPVEKPLVFALSRQESEFDPDAGSSVGAQGLMQLMPSTAELVARQHGISFDVRLLKDPAYNVRIGSVYLSSLVEDFKGSYILSLAAYNAGPRRSVEWMQDYGDPRGGNVDPIDFVECIPFNETRQYVQKVLQNLHVYRSRLEPATVRPMSFDLKRGQPEALAVASTTPLANQPN